MTNRRRRARWLLLGALVLGFLLQLVVAVRAQPYGSDSFHYLLLAKSLASGRGFVSGGSQHPDVTRMPVYPALIACAYLALRDLERAAWLVTAAGGALALVPLVMLARAMFGRRAFGPALVLGTLSCVIAVSWRLLPEPVYLPLVLGSVASTWWSVRRPSRDASLLTGVLSAIAAVTRAEGLAFVLFAGGWSFLDGGSARPGRPGRWARASLVLLSAGAIYAVYVATVSVHLGRFEPFPEVRYLRLMREVDDRFGLRHASGPYMAWADRSRFLLTEDQTQFVLESSFASGHVPTPEPTFVVPEKATYREDVPLSSTVVRRLGITTQNLRRVPTALKDMHLVPAVLAVLGSIGALACVASRRGRKQLLFLACALATALFPVVSHVEGRFLFPAFALALWPAAAGWTWLVGEARRAWPRSAVPAYVLWVLIAVAVAAAGATHLKAQHARLAEAAMRRDAAAWARDNLPAGPVLALEPGIPFWSGHAYRAIPMGGPEAVLAFARAQKAAAFSFEDPNDLERLPLLAPFRADTPPAGFRLLHEVKRSGVGSAKLFAVDPAP
jgi:hypothetical protein